MECSTSFKCASSPDRNVLVFVTTFCASYRYTSTSGAKKNVSRNRIYGETVPISFDFLYHTIGDTANQNVKYSLVFLVALPNIHRAQVKQFLLEKQM